MKKNKNRYRRIVSFALGASLLLCGVLSSPAAADAKVLPLRGRALSGIVSAQTLDGTADEETLDGMSDAAAARTESEALPQITEEAIHIAGVEDFLSFAESCTLDTWSQDKVFVLDCDLDLSGREDFSPVPTFGGCFLGQGHSISGLKLDSGSSDLGLFRYVQECGQIYQLSLSGIAQADSSHSGLALLAGCNAGLLFECHVTGNVSGGDRAGGLVGSNRLTGVISGCTAKGMVCGSHLVGGIAGSNEGCITDCTNYSLVNTTASDNNLDLSALELDTAITDVLTTENAASVTDIGGIAGSSRGVIRACINEGSVGYPHVGYNIGGIAGSQTGYIEGCVNYGHLNGRKDIGGIAGQMEPVSELEFLEDTLSKLDKEFDTLHTLLTRLNSDASHTSERLTGQIGQLLSSVESAQWAVDQILSDAGSHLEDFASLTDLASLPSPNPVSLDFLDRLPKPSFTPWPSWPASPAPSGTPEESASPTTSATPGGSPAPTPSATPEGSASPIPSATPEGSAAPTSSAAAGGSDTPNPSAGQGGDASPISTAGPDADTDVSSPAGQTPAPLTFSKGPEGLQAAQERHTPPALMGRAGSIRLVQMSDITGGQREASGSPGPTASGSPDAGQAGSPSPEPTPTRNPFAAGFPEDIFNYLPTTGITLDDVMDSIDREKIEENINQAQEHVYEDASRVLRSFQDTLQNQASLAVFRLASAQSSLSGSFSSIIADMRLLNSMIDEENQILLEDFQAVVDEVHVITDIITEYETPGADELLRDVSDEDKPTDLTGKVANCANRGIVEGDLDIGGIAGSLSRENNLDPENDLDSLDSATLNFRYKERIVVRGCENSGRVEGKKDRVGGIAGEMKLGTVLDCINQGTVKSDGSMVGGIAGYSASSIRSCSAKCTLSGKEQIGGIAGFGSAISDCRSMVNIPDGGIFTGSVAGKADSLSLLENNFFVDDGPAGVDGVSYSSLAQPVSHEEFAALSDLPEIFEEISLTFVADEETVDVVTLPYGASFPPQKLPPLPEKEGCTGKWEDFSYESVTFDRTVNAVYTEYITALESGRQTGERPVLLMEGQFSPDNGLLLDESSIRPEEGAFHGKEAEGEYWTVSLSGPAPLFGPFTLRYLAPQAFKHPVLILYEDGVWRQTDTQRDGSYLVFSSEKADLTFGCIESYDAPGAGLLLAAGVCALAVLAGAFILVRRRRRKKK